MTTEETYAIERLKVCTETAFASEDSHVTFFRDDAVTLLAEVERLRAEVERQRRLLETRARVIRRAIGAEEERTEERDDARAEVERVRAERDRATSNAEDFEGRYETAHANYMHALKVIDRYEAEREALHSDETRERLFVAIESVLIEYDTHDAPGTDAFVDAVLSVLTANSGGVDL